MTRKLPWDFHSLFHLFHHVVSSQARTLAGPRGNEIVVVSAKEPYPVFFLSL
jgi:hypothetical protein